MRSDRVSTALQAFYAAGREEGMGEMADVSISGARFDATTSQPRVGTTLLIKVLRPKGDPVELEGDVVRHAPGGFAVHFKQFTIALGDLLSELERKGKRA